MSDRKQHIAKNRRNFNVGTIKLPKIKFEIPALRAGSIKAYKIDLLNNILLLSAAASFLTAHFIKADEKFQWMIYAAPLILSGYSIFLSALENFSRGRYYCEETVFIISSVLTMIAGRYSAGAAILLFYRMSRFIEAVLRDKIRTIRKRLAIPMPKKAIVITNEGNVSVPVKEIQKGQILLIGREDVIPADGVVIEGESTLDTYILTGKEEEFPVCVGSRVASGCTNLSTDIKVRVEECCGESTAQIASDILYDAPDYPSTWEKIFDKAGKYFSFAVIVCGALMCLASAIMFRGEWRVWLTRGALTAALCGVTVVVQSIKLAYIGGIAVSAEHGIVISRHRTLEQMGKLSTLVFNKTGTITENEYTIENVVPHKISEDELLSIAATAEQYSTHPIARAICGEGGVLENSGEEKPQIEEIPCRGICVKVKEKTILVGNAGLLEEKGVHCEVPHSSNPAVHVAFDGKYCGYIVLSNKIKENAFDALESLRTNKKNKMMKKVSNMVMLTGDLNSVSRKTALTLNFGMVKTELDRKGKLTALKYLENNKISGKFLAYACSGCEDEELFKNVDVGISVGALGCKEALDHADVLIMDDDLSKIGESISIAQTSDRISGFNIMLFAAAKLLLLIGTFTGILTAETVMIAELTVNMVYAFNAWRTVYNKFD